MTTTDHKHVQLLVDGHCDQVVTKWLYGGTCSESSHIVLVVVVLQK